MLVSSIQPWQKTPRVGAAQLRDSPENCVRAAFAKSGMKREMGHRMGRHIIHTVAATEVDTRQEPTISRFDSRMICTDVPELCQLPDPQNGKNDPSHEIFLQKE